MDPPSVTADEGDPTSGRDCGGRGFTEEDDEDDVIAPLKASPSTSTSPSPSPSPSTPSEPSASPPPPAASNGRITVSLASQPERKRSPTASPSPTPMTTQEPAPLQVLALAVPSQNPFSGGTNFSGSSGGVGGREDYWTESATEVLIDVWAERYVGVTRGNLKQMNWKEVADIVNGAEDRSKTPRTDIQCKNRIDTVKKKYKTERARVVAGRGPSNWKFFEKMDQLLGHTVTAVVAAAKRSDRNQGAVAVAAGVKSGKGLDMAQKAGAKGQRSKSKSKKSGWGSNWESVGEDDEDNDDDRAEEENPMDRLLPPLPPPLRGKILERPTKGTDGNGHRRMFGGGSAMLELTRAIESFGEVYEKTESAKLREVVEMEKQRMKFAKEMEVQRMQFFMNTQVEIAKHVNKKARRDNRSVDADATEDRNRGCDAD